MDFHPKLDSSTRYYDVIDTFFSQNLELEFFYEWKHIIAQYKQFKNILYSIQQEISLVLVCTTGAKSGTGRTGREI